MPVPINAVNQTLVVPVPARLPPLGEFLSVSSSFLLWFSVSVLASFLSPPDGSCLKASACLLLSIDISLIIILIGREEECLTNLAMLRKSTEDAPEVQYEFRALQAERLVEREAAKERYGQEDVNFRVTMAEYKRLFTTKPLLHRLMLGAGCQTLQQWTGINAIIYYAPTIFEQIGLSGAGAGGTISLLATGIVGIVQFVFTIPAVLFVDNVCTLFFTMTLNTFAVTDSLV